MNQEIATLRAGLEEARRVLEATPKAAPEDMQYPWAWLAGAREARIDAALETLRRTLVAE